LNLFKNVEREKTISFEKENLKKKSSGDFTLKEPLALSVEGKNVHVKLLRLCACLLEEFFRKGRKFRKKNIVKLIMHKKMKIL
jgi:hypothetical protein